MDWTKGRANEKTDEQSNFNEIESKTCIKRPYIYDNNNNNSKWTTVEFR